MEKITEDEMVLEFLLAEMNSSRFTNAIQDQLHAQEDFELLLKPNLNNPEENKKRKQLLYYRGYESRDVLFKGIPEKIKWFKKVLSKDDFVSIKYTAYPTWLGLSKNTRRPLVAAKNLRQGLIINGETFDHIFEIAKKIKKGEKLYRIICIKEKTSKELIVAEGHSRLTAYAYQYPNIPEHIEIIIGEVEDISQWWLR
jgi:hypothetical protein